ncbi:MAG: hypothetical protein JNM57_15470 [Cyclobacteriaceae bacterium]|nr:hypothetical protein [Cyclobacteriaceae bacterium]
MLMRLLFILICVLLTNATFAQSGKKKKSSAPTKEASQPTSLNPQAEQKKNYEPKKSRKSQRGETTYNAEKQYYDRMAGLEKTRRKNERMLDDPQYSDPTYFGHKRPPKRRPPNKMKFCKVCGIRH